MCTYYESYLIRIKDSVVSRRLGEGPRGRWRHSQRLPVIKFATTPSRLTTVSSSLLHLLHRATFATALYTVFQYSTAVWCGALVWYRCTVFLHFLSAPVHCNVVCTLVCTLVGCRVVQYRYTLSPDTILHCLSRTVVQYRF